MNISSFIAQRYLLAKKKPQSYQYRHLDFDNKHLCSNFRYDFCFVGF